MKQLIVYTDNYNEFKKIFVKAKKEGFTDSFWWSNNNIERIYYDKKQRQNKTLAIRLDYEDKNNINYSDLEYYKIANIGTKMFEFISANKYLGIDNEELE